MTEEELKTYIDKTINETVERVVKELRTQGMIKDAEDANYKDISEMLREYYQSGEKDNQITYALQSMRFEPYFRILEKYYRNGDKIETIASDLGVDSSTVVRKKRELCLKLYHSL